jgi:hypothetical protein
MNISIINFFYHVMDEIDHVSIEKKNQMIRFQFCTNQFTNSIVLVPLMMLREHV